MDGSGVAERPAAAAAGRVRAALGLALIVAVALVVRLIGLDGPPFIDELFHVLAARSWLANGTFDIGAGVPYHRAKTFTLLVAAMFRLSGESLVSARLPGAIAGALLVGLVFHWVRREAGSGAGWIAGLMLCLYPFAIYGSQRLRFYPIHALLFWIAAFAVYRLALRPAAPATAIAIAAGAALALGLSFSLQPIAAVGVLALILWLLAVRGGDLRRWIQARSTRGRALLLILAGTLALGIPLGLPALFSRAWSLFHYADYWAFDNRDNLRYYYDLIGRMLGPLWPATPALFALAAFRRPRPAWFAGTIFATVLIFHSLAAWKIERYIEYAMPALFSVLGIGIAELIALAWQAARRGTGAASTGRSPEAATVGPGTPSPLRSAPRPPWARVAVVLVIAATSIAILDAAAATRRTLRFLTRRAADRPPPYSSADWGAARADLEPDLERADVVIASSDLKALYFLGRLDYDLSAEHLFSHSRMQPDFSVYARTGIPAIRSADAIRRIIACHPTGLLVAEQHQLQTEYAVPAATARALPGMLSEIPLPDRLGIRAWTWRHDPQPDAICPPR